MLVADDSSDSDSQSSVSAPQQFWLGSLRSGEKSNKNSVYAKLSVDQRDVFQLNSGSETNTICKQYVNRNSVRPTTRILRAWNGSQVKPIGEAALDTLNMKTNELYTAEFVVVPNNYSNLLGLATLGSMNLIHMNKYIPYCFCLWEGYYQVTSYCVWWWSGQTACYCQIESLWIPW